MRPNQTPVLDVRDLVGGYTRKTILHHLSFQIQPGEIVGLVGLNGAGKSTTIKHILGILEPLHGSVHVGGVLRKDSKKDYHAKMAYVPETPSFYEQLTLWEHLELTALAYGLDSQSFASRAEHLLKEFRMERMKGWLPDTFSKGMKQKLMIMSAFLVEPDLYIIDEPFVGLDPRAIYALLGLLDEERKRGAGILMSTHILSMIEKFCDCFILLHEGRIVLQGTMQEWKEKSGLREASLDEIFMQITEVERYG